MAQSSTIESISIGRISNNIDFSILTLFVGIFPQEDLRDVFEALGSVPTRGVVWVRIPIKNGYPNHVLGRLHGGPGYLWKAERIRNLSIVKNLKKSFFFIYF